MALIVGKIEDGGGGSSDCSIDDISERFDLDTLSDDFLCTAEAPPDSHSSHSPPMAMLTSQLSVEDRYSNQHSDSALKMSDFANYNNGKNTGGSGWSDPKILRTKTFLSKMKPFPSPPHTTTLHLWRSTHPQMVENL